MNNKEILSQSTSALNEKQDNSLKTCVRVERKIGNLVKQLESNAFKRESSIGSEMRVGSSIKARISNFETSNVSQMTKSENIPPEKVNIQQTSNQEAFSTADADSSHISQPSLLKLSSPYKSTPIKHEGITQSLSAQDITVDSSHHSGDSTSSIPTDLRNILSSSENQSSASEKNTETAPPIMSTLLAESSYQTQIQHKSCNQSQMQVTERDEKSVPESESFTIHANTLSDDQVTYAATDESQYGSYTELPSKVSIEKGDPKSKEMELFDSFELPYELSPAISKLTKFSRSTHTKASPILMNVSLSEDRVSRSQLRQEECFASHDGGILEQISTFSVKEAEYPFHFACLVHSEKARESAMEFYLKSIIECRMVHKQVELALSSSDTKQNSRSFFTEIIEAERLLLLTSMQLKHFLVRINSLRSYRDVCRCSFPKDTLNQKFFRASIVISDIQVTLKTHLYREWMSSPSEQEDIRLCAVIYFVREDEIFCTEAVSISSSINGSFLKLPGSFSTTKANSDSCVLISLYYLKKRFKQKMGVIGYITPKSFRRRREKSSPSHEFTSPTTLTRFYVQKSKFNSFGSVEINMNHNDSLSLAMVGADEKKDLPFVDKILRLKASVSPDYSIRMNGFLTVYQKSGGIHTWVRYWSVLNEKSLDLWKFPEDESKSCPLETIVLDWNIYKRVKKLDLVECFRPHTFEIFLRSSSSINLVLDDDETDDEVSGGGYSIKLAADSEDSISRWVDAFHAHQDRYTCWYNQKS